ncbi:hypothetical protein C491_16382 [Natronococcus amylolyticus DSM 10524]|uniref:Uncharacterized protein n=1 Tax=Natronococcus amylolyticus DSM 10524 TaxID=1227497 RepID=L9X0R0_9EURY|nr:hypothetical protein [Natronococcus amylolyticus]ELY55310.1 hypothetical protein C491_16382 [Natronococcus amylolyticus DSM 10524]
MLRTLLSRVLPGSDDGRDETDSDRDGADSEFAGSRLDASVVHAHGGDVTLENDADADEIESQVRAAEREWWRE